MSVQLEGLGAELAQWCGPGQAEGSSPCLGEPWLPLQPPVFFQLTNIYDAKTEQLRIGPYFWGPFPHVDFWLEQDDAQILQVPETNWFGLFSL